MQFIFRFILLCLQYQDAGLNSQFNYGADMLEGLLKRVTEFCLALMLNIQTFS